MELVALLYDQTGINRKWELQDGGFQTSNMCNSACTTDSNEISSVLPMFSGSSYQINLVLLLYDQTGINRKWVIQDGGLQTSNACTSACTQDINAIPTATLMFLGPAF